MRDTELFQQALGLEQPWRVVKTEFDASGQRLDLYLDFPAGSTFSCPECGAVGCKVHDTEEKSWRHLNFFQHRAYLHARTPRVRCTGCGVRLVRVPWARPGSGFTLLFEALIMTMVKDMPMAAIARLVNEHDTRLWRIIHHYVDDARERADFSDVRRVGVDEKASKRGHNYLTLFVDLDTPRLLFATESREASTFGHFRDELERHSGHAEKIEELCLDMWRPYLRGAGDEFPEARLTFDKFHLMQIVNRAVEQVRRAEQRLRPELRGSRYVWTKNPENLTPSQFAVWNELDVKQLNLKTARAYHMRLAFQEIWSQTREKAEILLKKWYFWATHSRLQPMINVAHMLRRHWNGVLNWFHSRISNGILEGINSLIQAAKAKARGYRTNRNLIAIAYIMAGKLDFRIQPT